MIEHNKLGKAFQTINQNATNEQTDGFIFMVGEENYDVDTQDNKISFILDSGATEHIINNSKMFSVSEGLPAPMKISIAKRGTFIQATKIGAIEVTSDLGVPGRLENVLYSKEIPYNLLSVRRLQQKGMTIIFDKNGVKIQDNNKTISTGIIINDLLQVIFKIPQCLAIGNNNINYK